MKEELNLGMVGLDTSHCVRFSELLNDRESEQNIKGGRITVAYPGGSRNFSNSINRVEGFTKNLKEDFGVKITDSIEKVANETDAILLTSVDGRQHLEQFQIIAPYGKPVFIDKPLATSVEDAKKIFELSHKHNSPVFSCSNARYRAGILELGMGDEVKGCVAFGPCAILPDYPGYFWYGVHCAEIVFSKMGVGCVEVSVLKSDAADVISGRWEDGRTAALYGYRIEEQSVFGCSVLGKEKVDTSLGSNGPPTPYEVYMPKILEFFNTGRPPFGEREMLEIVAFLEAANKSREKGVPVKTAL